MSEVPLYFRGFADPLRVSVDVTSSRNLGVGLQKQLSLQAGFRAPDSASLDFRIVMQPTEPSTRAKNW